MKMRILHFCPLPLYAGLEQYALKLAAAQIRLGYKVGFVALRGSMLEAECEKAGVPALIVDFRYDSSVLGAALQYRDIFLRHPEIEVVHLHTSKDIDRVALSLILSGRIRGSRRPEMIQQNHIWISVCKKDPVHWLIYRSLDQIWCSSETAKRDLLRYLPIPGSKVHVVHYGRDSQESEFLDRSAARRELGFREEDIVVGTVARIEKAKGIWELLQASIDQMTAGHDFHLVMIGGATLSDRESIAFSENIQTYLNGLPVNIRNRIHMPGWIPNAARVLKAFDLYAQVSYKETFSLALLDAQLAGLPAIGTNSGGTPEVVCENVTGWLCEPESIASLSLALQRALTKPELWRDYGAAARERVKKDFAFERVLQEILSKYHLKSDPLRKQEPSHHGVH